MKAAAFRAKSVELDDIQLNSDIRSSMFLDHFCFRLIQSEAKMV
jgi:hypothetical protein